MGVLTMSRGGLLRFSETVTRGGGPPDGRADGAAVVFSRCPPGDRFGKEGQGAGGYMAVTFLIAVQSTLYRHLIERLGRESRG